jgi:ring-1,2-phenylacetyl-CoA epoxidase subunit PaaC
VTPDVQAALVHKLTALADDELILAHRNSEWVGHAPILEEDIALANLTQDELGHAQLYLDLRRDLDGSDPDHLAFFRDAADFRCAQLVELPRGDWAFTMLRHYLFDLSEALWLQGAKASRYAPLAEVAAKIAKEERFHLQHSRAWVARLGLGTDESQRRAQAALTELWPYALQLFVPLPDEARLVEAGLAPDPVSVREAWLGHATAHLSASGLQVPEGGYTPTSRLEHTEHLWSLLAEMQSVARAEPKGVW